MEGLLDVTVVMVAYKGPAFDLEVAGPGLFAAIFLSLLVLYM